MIGQATQETAEPPAGEDEVEALAPFGVELGEAQRTPAGLAIAAIDGRGGKSAAVVALLGPDGTSGRVVELGRVYGEADPPRLAAHESGLLVATADMDASGRMLRLGRIVEEAGRYEAIGTLGERGASLEDFDVAVSGGALGVVWTTPTRQRGKLRLQRLDATHPNPTASSPQSLDGEATEIESPRLTPRQGGFWLTFIARSGGVKAAPRAPAPAAKAGSQEREADEPRPVELGAGILRSTALDLNLKPLGAPITVSGAASHVVAYDRVSAEAGALLVTYRDDDTTPGAEARLLWTARIGLDGSVTRERFEDEGIGAGAPSWLVERAAGRPTRTWLAVPGNEGQLSLIGVSAAGKPEPPLRHEALLGNAEPLLWEAGRLWVGRPRGTTTEIESLDCSLLSRTRP